MADVHRLVQVDEISVLPQAVEELAEIFLHDHDLRVWLLPGSQ